MELTEQLTIQPTGFTTLYNPSRSPPIADIVLVHGLQGSPRGTWSSPLARADHQPPTKSKEPDAKSKRKGLQAFFQGFGGSNSLFSTEQTVPDRLDKDGRLHWPRDLLPNDCPDCRIMVWGYDSKVTKGYVSANKSNLFSHAKDLLYALERVRPYKRPIVFVAHSLGGLMVKETLRRSQHSEDPRLQDIIGSTISVIFMGTPHRGSAGYASLGELTRKIASTVLRVDSNMAILRALGLDSPELELSRGSFLQQWRIYNFQVKTFQESSGPNGMNIGGFNEKIVPDISSSLDDPRERAETLQGDHRSMTKFTGSHDSNYIKVAGEIVRVINLAGQGDEDTKPEQTANNPESPPVNGNTPLCKEETDALGTLVFTTMLNREQNIRDAMDNTCGWFYSSAEYNSWYTGDNARVAHGLLWVKGKPGAGKSTIMKHAVQQVRRREETAATIAAFYFNARGAPLERTPLGLFRSILHQIISQDRGIRMEFLKLYSDRQKTTFNHDEWSWNRMELENFLKVVFEKLQPRRTFIFIDALDECDVDSVREIVHFLAAAGASAFRRSLDLRICLSSRHYPTISIQNCPEIMVEGANTTDIGTYIREKFKFIPESEQDAMAAIEAKLIENAAGVFLWIVLVVDLLLQDVDAGQPVQVITERLKRVPRRMEDLYAELCASLKPEEVVFSLRLFQWVLVMDARDIQDTCLAALFATPGSWERMTDWGYSEDAKPPIDRLVRVLKNYTRGLIEYTSGTVQFIHETAREFFLTGPGFTIIDSDLAENPIGITYKAVVMTSLDIIEFPLDWRCVSPLRAYCTRDILYKARKAEEEDISMVPLLDRIGISNSRTWSTIGKRGEESLLHFLCYQRLTSCVIACLERGVDPDSDGYPNCDSTPLLVAVGRGYRHKTIPKMVSCLIAHGAKLNRCDPQNNSPFMVALKSGHPHLAKLLRDAGADVDVCNNSGECGLHIILDLKGKSQSREMWTTDIKAPYEELFHNLVTGGVRVDAKAFAGSTPLHYAAYFGDVRAVELLIKYGAEVNVESETGSPLTTAAQSTSPTAPDVCLVLLRSGSNIYYRDRYGRTALHIAARCSTVSTVRMLITHGFDVNDVDKHGQNALHRAAERAVLSKELIGVLLDANCSPYARDINERTPWETALQFSTHVDQEGLIMLQAGQLRKAPTWELWRSI